ncbi:MAG TPA: hypothetical protein VNU21_06125 [Usitatibacter sp.]|jgi:hypothetical protein|nr:hypothetical protein [Usitatibacter sp.]
MGVYFVIDGSLVPGHYGKAPGRKPACDHPRVRTQTGASRR